MATRTMCQINLLYLELARELWSTSEDSFKDATRRSPPLTLVWPACKNHSLFDDDEKAFS